MAADSEDLSRFQVWVLACRPKTLPAAAAPVLIGSVMAYEIGSFAFWPAVAALLGALAIQVGTNLANDYYDHKSGADEGERLGPLRVTQAGLVEPTVMFRATAMAFGLAFLSGVYLVYVAGWPIVAIGLTSIAFGYLYTGGPYPLGYNGLGDIFVLIYFGPVAVGGTYFVQTLHATPEVLIAGLAPGLFSVAILSVNNLRDIDNDRLSGKRTLAVRLGPTFAKWEYLFATAAGSVVPLWLYARDDSHPWSMLTLTVPLFALPCYQIVVTRKGRVLNNVLAATGKLLLMYAMLFGIGWLI